MKAQTIPLHEKANAFSVSSPYQLSNRLQDSDAFYLFLDLFTDKVTEFGHNRFANFIKRYRCSVAYLQNDFTQTLDENLLDVLIMGVLWNEYKGRWGNSIKSKEKILTQLFYLRKTNAGIKSQVDNVRGKLSARMLNNSTVVNATLSLANFALLSSWLSATTEYNEEVVRMRSWIKFLEGIPSIESEMFLKDVVSFADWFKTEARIELKKYTRGVDSFLASHKQKYQGKENYFFTGRHEVEYHLNMVGASILNKSMRKEFMETDYQVLLLPSCMTKGENCQSMEIMQGTVCTHCSANCNVSRVSREMLRQGTHTFIIKHSSGFSSYLKKWANQKKVGLIGTACTLNLLAGGFEMKRQNIPSQCVFLDYSGCKKHWNEKGIPTDISLSQIKSIAGVKETQAV